MRTPQQIMADAALLPTKDGDKATEPPWPPPERYATPTTELPRGAKVFAKLCQEWWATSARGPTGAQAAPGWRMADSLVLKGRVGQRRFVACWLEKPDGSMGLILAYAHGVAGRLTSDQLKWYLTQDNDIPWIEGVGFLPRTNH